MFYCLGTEEFAKVNVHDLIGYIVENIRSKIKETTFIIHSDKLKAYY